MKNKNLVVAWDWDGTLVDTFPVIHKAFNEALKAFSLPTWSLEEAHARIARSAREVLPIIFGVENVPKAEEVFYEAYTKFSAQSITPYAGRKALLDVLKELGHDQIVISNKRGPLLRKECESLGWNHYFKAVVGANDAFADKPHASPWHLAQEKAGYAIDPQHVVYIGDSPIDAAFAKTIGAGCILLSGQTHDENTLKQHAKQVVPFSKLHETLVNL